LKTLFNIDVYRSKLIIFISLSIIIIFIPFKTHAGEPFGTYLGEFNGVAVYSNNIDSYYSGAPHYVNGTYTVIEWQCVEYVRRYYFLVFGIDLSSLYTGDAQTWYDNASTMGLSRYPNSGSVAPQVGDIMVSTAGANGHIAIVRAVSNNEVCTVQQNFSNDSVDVNRCLALSIINGIYTVSGFSSGYPVEGWLRKPSLPGTQKWAFRVGGDWLSSPSIGMDGTIYVGLGELYAINPDGTQKWAFPASIASSPAIGGDGTIYVGSIDHNLYALNPDGSQKWVFTTGWDLYASPAIGGDGTIYVGSDDYNLYAVNPDGSQKWAFTTDSYIRSSPAIGGDGTIYVGSCYGKLYALNPDGSQKWAFLTGGPVYSSPAIGRDGTIYVAPFNEYLGISSESRLHALNPDDYSRVPTPP
jgi:outer membrane protein assembly factor BamB